jgi:hypothetical protein
MGLRRAALVGAVFFALALAGLVLVPGRAALAQLTPPTLSGPIVAGPLTAAEAAEVGHQRLSAQDGALTVQAPASWSDAETGRWIHEGRDVGVYVAAAPDLGAFYRMAGPGAFVGVSRALAQSKGVDGLLAAERTLLAGRCRHADRFAYADRFYAGAYEAYLACPSGHNRLVAAALGQGGDHVVVIRAGVASAGDLAAVRRVLATFQVRGQLEGDHHHDD